MSSVNTWLITFGGLYARRDWGWLGQVFVGTVPLSANEWPDGDTNDVLGKHVITAYTGATRNSHARFASEISPKLTFRQPK